MIPVCRTRDSIAMDLRAPGVSPGVHSPACSFVNSAIYRFEFSESSPCCTKKGVAFTQEGLHSLGQEIRSKGPLRGSIPQICKLNTSGQNHAWNSYWYRGLDRAISQPDLICMLTKLSRL